MSTLKTAWNEEIEWAAIGAGELARVADFSRTSSAASCDVDEPTSPLHDARSMQNRMMGLLLERARCEKEAREEAKMSQSEANCDTAEDAWAREFEELCTV